MQHLTCIVYCGGCRDSLCCFVQLHFVWPHVRNTKNAANRHSVSMGFFDRSQINSWIENTQRSIASSCPGDTEDGRSSQQRLHPFRLELNHPVQTVTPPPSKQNSAPRKRRRSMPATERSSSPQKRRRVQDSDTVFSPSRTSSRKIPILDNSTVLSATSQGSSPKRNNSPTRDHAIELRTAVPSIQTDSLIGAHIPERVRELRKFLTTSFGRAFLPTGLKACSTPNTYPGAGV
jgi:hypothetical protein